MHTMGSNSRKLRVEKRKEFKKVNKGQNGRRGMRHGAPGLYAQALCTSRLALPGTVLVLIQFESLNF